MYSHTELLMTPQTELQTTMTKTKFIFVSIPLYMNTEDYSRFVSLRPTVIEQQQTAEGHGISI